MPYNQHKEFRFKHQAHETPAVISQTKTGDLHVETSTMSIDGTVTFEDAVVFPTTQVALNRITETVAFDDFTDGGATTATFTLTAGTIPAGATVLRSVLTAITGFTGDTTATLQVGDGTDVDRYSTGTPSIFTTVAGGADLGVPSGTPYHATAKSVILTATSGADWASVDAGSLTIEVYYYT